MNYEYIEGLVKKSKDGDAVSKEKLVNEFKPYILKLCKHTFIDGYEFHDVENECYRILFKCISFYNLENHRFVAYATNGIRNSIYDLIKKNKNRSCLEGSESLILDDQLEHTLASDSLSTEDFVCDKLEHQSLILAIKNLEHDEQDLINAVFFKNIPLKEYAKLTNMSYYAAIKKKKLILKKLSKQL